MSESRRIDCTKCRHYYITWDPNFPRGCRSFGFKTSAMPSLAVQSSSGKPCMSFEAKPGKTRP
ncbi:uracil-DNA glycosylase [Cohnella cellulosilytica]|uniref:Uracil-DNA glycosylase n=1 Tax=Cohnella cellulosilytica TaxID=986710 RepID=A0ABW2F1R9_9BACL